tara:strand:+ start:144 stop:545 length:402 start_codon:yes stop_codon:yes gene_type:complete
MYIDELTKKLFDRLLEEMHDYYTEAMQSTFCDVRGDFISPDAECAFEIFIQARQHAMLLFSEGLILDQLKNEHRLFDNYAKRIKKSERTEFTLHELQQALPIDTQVELLQYQIEVLQEQIISQGRRIKKLENQ